MSALNTRVARLEVERRQAGNCELCFLILWAARGEMTESEARALSAHPSHTLEQIVMAAVRWREVGDVRRRSD